MPRGSERIRVARRQLGLSQLQLATRAGVCVRTVQFAEAGKSNLHVATIELIAMALGLTVQQASKRDHVSTATPIDDETDRLPWSIIRFVQHRSLPGAECFLRTEEAVLGSLVAMRRNWKLHLEQEGTAAALAVFSRGDRMLDERRTFYQQRYLSIWRTNPHCFQLARYMDQCCGLVVVLPISDDAYAQFRDGHLSFMDITDAHIEPTSQNLVLDSATDFPVEGCDDWTAITDSLMYALFCRIAALSSDPMQDDFRMLSFGASEVNLHRLLSLGFSKTQTTMPDFRFPICELSVAECSPADSRYASAATTVHFAKMLKPVER